MTKTIVAVGFIVGAIAAIVYHALDGTFSGRDPAAQAQEEAYDVLAPPEWHATCICFDGAQICWDDTDDDGKPNIRWEGDDAVVDESARRIFDLVVRNAIHDYADYMAERGEK